MDVSALSSSTAQQPQALSQLTDNFDTFLTLLTTQLRNQDPLAPLDTEKFTEQLVQFASVEQSIKTNQHLEALIALQSSSASETALAMVGRIASVGSDVAALTNDEARWTYDLPENAADIAISIFDSSGALVAKLGGPSGEGAHQLIWNGETSTGRRAPQGAYRLVVDATDSDGAPISVEIAARGRVDAVAFDNGTPEIEIAGQRFTLDLVSRIDADF